MSSPFEPLPPLAEWTPGSDEAPEPEHPDWIRPGPASEAELSFRRQPMVSWLDPKQLMSTGIQAVLSAVFGSYADRREVQAALHAPRLHCFDGEEEIWIDYTADLGDGFDSTYTVASQLAAKQLTVDGVTLERGRILVLGGDQVYPTASREEYTNRFSGPYEAALPCVPGSAHPYLFAIPGNHDWYDGLTAFMRLFCQGRWVGGWKTAQNRSYFALRLPHRWWLLGTDFQLHADVDKPQLDYFAAVSRQMQPGDRVILCTPEPSWVSTALHATAFDNLAFFEKTVLAPAGAKLAVTLAGDLHHYARYANEAGEQKITAGGGGAYLYGTHCLPERLTLRHGPGREEQYRRAAVYPEVGASRAARGGALFGFMRNRRFAALLAAFYTFFAWVLQSASMSRSMARPGSGQACPDFMQCVAGVEITRAPEVLRLFGMVVAHAPFLLFLCVLIVWGCYQFCTPDPGTSRARKLIGIGHGVAHLLLGILLTWGFASLNAGIASAAVRLLVFSLEMLVIGGALGGVLFGLFLLPGVNLNEAFSAQHLSDYRNFIRLHIDRAGELTIYPVGIARSVGWRLRPESPPCEPYFEPAGDAPEPQFIETPIRVASTAPVRPVQGVAAQ